MNCMVAKPMRQQSIARVYKKSVYGFPPENFEKPIDFVQSGVYHVRNFLLK